MFESRKSIFLGLIILEPAKAGAAVDSCSCLALYKVFRRDEQGILSGILQNYKGCDLAFVRYVTNRGFLKSQPLSRGKPFSHRNTIFIKAVDRIFDAGTVIFCHMVVLV